MQLLEALAAGTLAVLTAVMSWLLGSAAAVITFLASLALLRALGRVARHQRIWAATLGFELTYFCLACIFTRLFSE